MTNLSPYQITSAKSAPVLPPKVQATMKPFGAWDEESLAAAWAKSARAERHQAAAWMVKQGEAKIVEHRRGGKTIIAYCAFNAPDKRENVKDRYTAYPITVRGVTYPSFNACAEALGVTPTTVYYHWLRKTADKIGLGRWKDGSAE